MKQFFKQPAFAVSIGTCLFLSATEAPLFMIPLVVLVLFWRWLFETRHIPKIPRKLTNILSLLLLLLVYLYFRAVFTQEASNTLLMGLMALKIMDYETERDHRFLILLGFVLISMKFIFSIDLFWLIPTSAAFLGLWYSMSSRIKKERLWFLSRLLIASLPLTILLFFAFPRIIVPWAMSRSASVLKVGFSDQLDPGSVAELAQSEEIAFRAKFHDRIQVTSDLYWRGSVLTESHGMKWLPPNPPKRGRSSPKRSSQGIDYEVVLEAGSRGFLFTLDHAKRVSSETLAFDEFYYSVFRSRDYLAKSSHYKAVSDPEIYDERAPESLFLKFNELSPKAKAWVDKIKSKNETSKERLVELERFFKNPDFVYTLKPGIYPENDLDEFLFGRRLGFCEHFAGSYATLARALGIPSRVVVGYHGGVFNVFGNFWKVSQRDAHAWVEVYTDGRWERVDPTEWIAPLRLTLGGVAFFRLPEAEQISFARSPFWTHSGEAVNSYFDALTLWLDDLNYKWTYFMLDFDSEAQRSFWSDLTKELSLFIVLGLMLVFLALVLVRFTIDDRISRSPIETLMDQIIKWSERRGIPYHKNQSPLFHLSQLMEAFPHHAQFFESMLMMYDQSIYGIESINKEKFNHLESRWRKVKAERTSVNS